MSRRFEYAQMTGPEFSDALARIGWSEGTFARATGARMEAIKEWLSGGRPIPHWAKLMLAMMEEFPALKPFAKDFASETITRDRRDPDARPMPYLDASYGDRRKDRK